jgi:hypothetical protein
MKIKSNFKFILLFGIFLISSIVWNPVLAQIPPETGLSININTPAESASVPSGDLTIYGTSSDDGTKNCQVYADWNDLKPMQNVTPDGPKGNEDYSKWSYTYTGSYHNIVEGSNELTSKITCFDLGQNASSKFYSINVTGTKDGSEITNNAAQQSNETTNTNKEAANILPVKNTKSGNTNNTAQQSNETTNTNKEAANKLPVKNTQKSGTYKILPLYSESNEKVTNPASSKDGDKTEVTTTDTSESHDTQDSVKTDSTDAKTLSSEPQQESVGTTAYDTSKSHVTKNTDKGLSTDTNKYFTFEPNLHEDQKISENDNNPMNNNPDSDSSLPNHYNEGDSVFGLKMKGLGEDTKNQLDNKVQKLEERPPDHTHAFGSIR